MSNKDLLKDYRYQIVKLFKISCMVGLIFSAEYFISEILIILLIYKLINIEIRLQKKRKYLDEIYTYQASVLKNNSHYLSEQSAKYIDKIDYFNNPSLSFYKFN